MKDYESRLIELNLINTEQLYLAKQEAAKAKKTLWSALIKLNYLSQEDIVVFFAQESGVPYAKLSNYRISPKALSLVDESFCRENCVIPIFKVQNRLFVACCNPLDAALIDNLSKLSGCEVEALVASADSIIKAQDLHYGQQDKVFELEKLIFKQKSLRKVGFYRDAERLDLKIPVNVNVLDEDILMENYSGVEGYTRNISRGGTAIGLQMFLYLPAGIRVSLSFRPQQSLLSGSSQVIEAKGEIVHCLMEKKLNYSVGIKFTEITDKNRDQLIKLACTK